jgi:hypothetical protein
LLPPGLAIGTVVADPAGGYRVVLLADSSASEDVNVVDFKLKVEQPPATTPNDLPATAAGLPPAAPPAPAPTTSSMAPAVAAPAARPTAPPTPLTKPPAQTPAPDAAQSDTGNE